MKTLRWIALVAIVTPCNLMADNWNAWPELAETPASWTYGHTPGYYFALGVGLGFTFKLCGWGVNFLRSIETRSHDIGS